MNDNDVRKEGDRGDQKKEMSDKATAGEQGKGLDDKAVGVSGDDVGVSGSQLRLIDQALMNVNLRRRKRAVSNVDGSSLKESMSVDVHE